MLARADNRVAKLPALLDEMVILRRKWRAALAPGRNLPRYEDVVLGSLGRMADDLLLFAQSEPHCYALYRAGRRIKDWIGHEGGATLDDLPADCAGALREILDQSLAQKQPAFSVAHRVQDGMVETCNMLALPLANRWGPPLIAVYVKESRERYNLVDTIFRSTEAGILALAAVRDATGVLVDFQIVALNEGASRLLRRSEQELRWRKLSDLRLDLAAAGVLDRLYRTLQTRKPDQFELDIPLGDDVVHLKVDIASIGDLVSATLTDIGDVRAREASFRMLFEGNPVPMYLYCTETLKFVGVNAAAIAHYGYSVEQFLTMTVLDIKPREDWDPALEAIRQIGRASHLDRTWRHLKADGSQIEVLAYARNMMHAGKPAVLVAIVDVTERRQAEARIAHMAHHDALTDLPNRVRFNARLVEALGRQRRPGQSLAVHCLDLDHFKSVNDTLGHPIGDQLLKSVAERLRNGVGEADLVARLGGDEFAVIQSDIAGPNEASALAARLIELLSAPYEVQGHAVVVGASIGIALAPSDGSTPDVLLRNADMALYRAKAEGRGTLHFFEPEMDRAIQARRMLELDLRKAFGQGEFELHYQPVVDLKNDRISGFEALLRWRHPERGLIPPGRFIPLAEEIGLIIPLGEWVIRQACVEAACWPGNFKIAVNLSPVQFKSKNLVPAVISALAWSRLPASRLEFEITESVLLTENEHNLAVLHQLRELGVRISMDDFGTGYSSLSYLRSFPFDKIKIDQSFVGGAERPDCMAIIRAVAGLGASLGITTTAEGVETKEQLERLRAEGCTEVQGYLFSPPRPASEIVELLRSLGPEGRVAA